MLYTVGEMAKVLGIPASTLRYYDKEKLLPCVERSKGGIRMFTDKDFEWLKVIECLKKSGLSIKRNPGLYGNDRQRGRLSSGTACPVPLTQRLGPETAGRNAGDAGPSGI